MEVGKKYRYKGEVYVYRGEWNGNSTRPGIYTKGKKIKVIKDRSNTDLLNEVLSNRNIDGITKKHSMINPTDISGDKDESINIEQDQNRRISLNEALRYTISPKDDQMVRLVKEQINLRNIKAGSLDYNLIYGLRIRNTMKYETFLKWAEILGMTVKITLI